MPRLVYSSEKFGSGATIELDSGEICIVSVAQTGVSIRSHKKGMFLGSFRGPILYRERNVYAAAKTALALSSISRAPNPHLKFNNVVLNAFAKAVWDCSSAAEVAVVINEAAKCG